MRLQRTHFHSQNPLTLGRKRGENVLLQPSQHERLELLVELLDLLLMVNIAKIELVGQLDYRCGQYMTLHKYTLNTYTSPA